MPYFNISQNYSDNITAEHNAASVSPSSGYASSGINSPDPGFSLSPIMLAPQALTTASGYLPQQSVIESIPTMVVNPMVNKTPLATVEDTRNETPVVYRYKMFVFSLNKV